LWQINSGRAFLGKQSRRGRHKNQVADFFDIKEQPHEQEIHGKTVESKSMGKKVGPLEDVCM
jgi:hypothetical protein